MIVISPEVHHTANGTPYLKEPGLALLSQPQFHAPATHSFIASFGDTFDADEYVRDFYVDDIHSADYKIEDGTALAKFAGQLCYLSFGENRTRNADAEKYFENIKSSGHGSVMEHANYSMLFWGIGRDCTHELVRHRAGFGFSQVSQRYVSGKTLRFVERPEYVGDERLHFEFENWIDKAKEQYDLRADLLKDIGAHLSSPTEKRKARNQAARACLPNETEAPIVVTANVRGWRHFFENRANKHADRPIQALARNAFEILSKVAPIFFCDYTTDGNAVETPYRKV